MKRIAQLLSFIGVFTFLIYSCSSEYRGYEKSESGVYYKSYTQNDGLKAKIGDEISFQLKYSQNDSIIFDSYTRPATKIVIPEEQYVGDIYSCFTLMAAGDSASFIIEADSFFLITANMPQIPAFIEPKSKLYADVKILSIKTKEDLELETNKLMADLKAKEIEDIENFKSAQKMDQEFVENTGIYYKSVKKGTGNIPNPTDIITVEYAISYLDGIVVFDSKSVEEDIIFECMNESVETKGFNLIISKMKKGQKANFVLPSELAYGETGIPNRLQPYTPLNYIIEIINIQDKETYNKEKEAKDNSFINVENDKISSYLKKNNITTPPRESGLYYIEKLEGSGRFVKKGDNVKVHYTLYNLDGKKIDSSVDRGTPIEFIADYGQVIDGWVEALTLMKKGGKATLIIPSKIAYGERKRSADILPYTPLLFEVELIEIVE